VLVIEPLSEENAAYACAMAKELRELGAFRDEVPFHWDYFFGFLLRIIDDKTYYFRLAKLDGVYVGGMCGHLQPFIFAPTIMGMEDAWYVREGTPFRAKVGMMLMNGFVDWCYGHNAVMVQSGDVAGINTVGVHALYGRMGFERFGTIYRNKRI
jgi:hypothetical protein